MQFGCPIPVRGAWSLFPLLPLTCGPRSGTCPSCPSQVLSLWALADEGMREAASSVGHGSAPRWSPCRWCAGLHVDVWLVSCAVSSALSFPLFRGSPLPLLTAVSTLHGRPPLWGSPGTVWMLNPAPLGIPVPCVTTWRRCSLPSASCRACPGRIRVGSS